MSFAENLKQLRKEKQLSQEELAELLDVSRQAVSKWEQGMGYPEVEKLLLLSNKLRVSLDSLMETQFAQEPNTPKQHVTGTITITSPDEHVIATCQKVIASGKMSGGKTSPQYALFGKNGGSNFFGDEPTTFLGWYAIVNGIATYTLKHSVRTKRRLLGIKIEL